MHIYSKYLCKINRDEKEKYNNKKKCFFHQHINNSRTAEFP